MPYVRDSFWRGREFASLAQMQAAAVAWCREVAGRRAVPAAGRCRAGVGVRRGRGRGAATVAGQAVRAGDVVDGDGRAGHPRQGRQDDLLGAVAVHRASGSTPARPPTDGADLPQRAVDRHPRPQAAGQADRLSATTRRRRSRSGCGPRPGAAPAPPRSARPAPQVIDELLEVNALFRLRAAQGVLGLADKHGPGRLEAACAKAIAVGDPSYRTIKGILVAGAETDPPPPSAGDGGAAAHLHGPSQLFANVIPLPTTNAAPGADPATTSEQHDGLATTSAPSPATAALA